MSTNASSHVATGDFGAELSGSVSLLMHLVARSTASLDSITLPQSVQIAAAGSPSAGLKVHEAR
jgi:hypothetical protein